MKHTMVGLILFLLATSAWARTLRDNFDDGNLDGWRLFEGKAGDVFIHGESAQWFVEEGELVCLSQGVCRSASTLGIGDNTWKDYEFECQAKVEQAFLHAGCDFPSRRPFFSIGVRYDDTKGFITGTDVKISTEGDDWNAAFCELFFQGDADIVEVAVNFPIKEGRWYALRIVADGNRYRMFINDTLVCNFLGRFRATGAAAILGRNCEVHFDNVVITGDEIPKIDMNFFAVSPEAKLTTAWGRIKSF